MPLITHPVFATVCKPRFGAKLEDEGKTVAAGGGYTGFALFGGAPIATGVFKCTVAFGKSSSESQHIGVLPGSAAAAAATEVFWEHGFFDAKIKGWGCSSGDEEGAHSVQFYGKTVEMVVDAEGRTVVIGNPGGPQCRFKDVAFPVIPAINIAYNTATLESSNHKIPQTPKEKQAMAEEVAAKEAAHKAAEEAAAKEAAYKAQSASQSKRLEHDLVCPQGHALLPYRTKFGGRCDGCKKTIHPWTTVADCRQCNWYLCDTCRDPAVREAVEKKQGGGCCAVM